jgi:hypothetical protein
MSIMQNDCLLQACIADRILVQAASTPFKHIEAASTLSKHIQAACPTYTLIWDVVPLLTAMLPSACHDTTKVSVFGC